MNALDHDGNTGRREGRYAAHDAQNERLSRTVPGRVALALADAATDYAGEYDLPPELSDAVLVDVYETVSAVGVVLDLDGERVDIRVTRILGQSLQ